MDQLRILKDLLEESKKSESELNSFEIQAIEWAILVIESQIEEYVLRTTGKD